MLTKNGNLFFFFIARARTQSQKFTAKVVGCKSVYPLHLAERSVTISAFRHLVHLKQLLLFTKCYFYLVVSHSSAGWKPDFGLCGLFFVKNV